LVEGDDLALGTDGIVLCSRLHGSLTRPPDSFPSESPALELERHGTSVGGSQWRATQTCWPFNSRIPDRFDFYVESGSWQLLVSFGNLQWTAPEPLSMEGPDVAHDVVIPPDSLKEHR
jgi:hypothetical protein